MTVRAAKRKPKLVFGDALAVEELRGLAEELQQTREVPPLVHKGDGRYEGSVLGFVKGLRLSARMIYFLRGNLSSTGLNVNWGHILSKSGESVSPECDIIVHTEGFTRRWNSNEHPVMDFVFVEPAKVRAVVSCKSYMQDVDGGYPADLRKYGVKNVFLFAETCKRKKWKALCAKARKAKYKGVGCLYFDEDDDGEVESNERMYHEFVCKIQKAVMR